jgi:Fe2+ or Zn2+ uptake regulation protein
MEITERQKSIAQAISKGLNGITSADRIAARLGYRPARTGRLAVTKTLRSMEAAGLVHRLPPKDQWDHADWALSDEGKKLTTS